MSDLSEQFARLREPFPPYQIGKLPRRGRGGQVIELDYVSHAWVTDRLLSVDPSWSWEPVAWDQDGLPKITINELGDAVMWIKLTVCGITKLGVGNVQRGDGQHDLEKQLVSDAIRNAAMRFGVALDCWAKETEGPVDNSGSRSAPVNVHRTQAPRKQHEDKQDGTVAVSVAKRVLVERLASKENARYVWETVRDRTGFDDTAPTMSKDMYNALMAEAQKFIDSQSDDSPPKRGQRKAVKVDDNQPELGE